MHKIVQQDRNNGRAKITDISWPWGLPLGEILDISFHNWLSLTL